MRVLIDTNVFISFLLFPWRDSPSSIIVRAALLRAFVLLLPEALLEEFVTKARQKPYLAERVHPEDVDELVQLLWEVAEIIPRITEPVPAVTRDPKDDYLIAYALVGAADYLITGDRDLLTLGEVDGVEIITAGEFLNLLEDTRG